MLCIKKIWSLEHRNKELCSNYKIEKPMKIGKLTTTSRNVPILYTKSVISGTIFFLPILALYLQRELFSTTYFAIVYAVEAFILVLFEVYT